MLEELQELPSASRPLGDLVQEAVEMRWVVIDCVTGLDSRSVMTVSLPAALLKSESSGMATRAVVWLGWIGMAYDSSFLSVSPPRQELGAAGRASVLCEQSC